MSAKAEPRSISFNPASLYTDAKNYGSSRPQRSSPSAVVCEALTHFLREQGALTGDPDNEFIAKITAVVRENPEMKPVLEKFIREQARSRKGRVAA